MAKKVILILAIAAAAVGAGLYLSGQEQKPRSPGQRPELAGKGGEIIYSDSGYSPKILKVKSGTTVIFKNQSSRAMWTASDVHPTHTILPEFDARKATPPGESYSFTFTKTGQWNHHNHLSPGDGGTIIVE